MLQHISRLHSVLKHIILKMYELRSKTLFDTTLALNGEKIVILMNSALISKFIQPTLYSLKLVNNCFN